jgi:hypothetical protein
MKITFGMGASVKNAVKSATVHMIGMAVFASVAVKPPALIQ